MFLSSLPFKKTIIAATAALGFMAAVSANAQTANTITIIDTQVIFEKSSAVQKVKDQLDKKAEEFKKEFSKKEDYFKKKYEDLEKQKSVLSKEVFEQKNNELAKEFNDAQKKVQDNRNALDKAYGDAMEQFQKTLNDIIKDEANKAGSKVVLPKMQTMYSDASLDITNQVLENLNKKLPSITVKF